MNLTEIGIFHIIKESYELLRKEPSLFVPKIFSSLIGALWFIGLIESFGSRMAYLASYPLMVFLSVAVAYLVSALVKQENDGLNLSYRNGIMSLLSKKKQMIYTTLALTIAVFVMSLPMAVGYTAYLLFFNPAFLILGALVTLIFTLVFAVAIYFLPATLVSEDSFVASIKKSAQSANEHRKDVLLLTLFSFGLLLLASTTSGLGRTLGYAGFLAGRMVSAVFSTYTYVISPKYYFEN